MIRSVPLWGVVLDASKCFDSLAVASVCAIAEKLGVDAVLLSAISRWYISHERRVVVSQWIQRPVKPKRGLLQGCPLSVALCSIWGLVWVEKVSVILGSLPPQISYSNVYMDDMSFLASSRDKVELAMGFSGVYMAAWGIEINKSKSRLLVNASASSQEGPNVGGISVEVEHSLLGISAGSESTPSEILRRLCNANRRLDRLDVLPLPQRSYQRLVSVFCSSLLYGIEIVPYSAALLSYDRRLRRKAWGGARCSANYHLVRALVFHPEMALDSRKAIACGRAIWKLANDSWKRDSFMEVWRAQIVPRQAGLWKEWIALLARWGAKLRPDGSVWVRWRFVRLHLNASYREWQHMLRLCLRLEQMELAKKQNPTSFDFDVDWIDWQLMKLYQDGADGLQTLICNGVNTKTRAATHFGVDVSPHCEHGCGVPDVPHHRLYHCEATLGLRALAKLTPQKISLIDEMPQASKNCAIWQIPWEVRDEILTPSSSSGLWPTQEWLRDLQRSACREEGDMVCTLQYSHSARGTHPQGKRHAAQLILPEGLLALSIATGTMDQVTRTDWELDAWLISALIHTFLRRRVKLCGLTLSVNKVKNKLMARACANAHLAGVALASISNEGVVGDWSVLPDYVVPGAWQLKMEKAIALTTMRAIAVGVQEIIEDSYDLFPVSRDISRSHGNRHRGGQEPYPSHDVLLAVPDGMTLTYCRSPSLVSDSLSLWESGSLRHCQLRCSRDCSKSPG